MPRVITPGTCGPALPESGVSPRLHPAPWPRVSICRCANPAEAQSRFSSACPRPPPYPTYWTTAGSGPVLSAGRRSAASPDVLDDGGQRTGAVRRQAQPRPDRLATEAGEGDVEGVERGEAGV